MASLAFVPGVRLVLSEAVASSAGIPARIARVLHCAEVEAATLAECSGPANEGRGIVAGQSQTVAEGVGFTGAEDSPAVVPISVPFPSGRQSQPCLLGV